MDAVEATGSHGDKDQGHPDDNEHEHRSKPEPEYVTRIYAHPTYRAVGIPMMPVSHGR